MWRVVVGAALFVGSICSAPATADPILGAATVIDGDTIRVDDTRIRLRRERETGLRGHVWCQRQNSLPKKHLPIHYQQT